MPKSTAAENAAVLFNYVVTPAGDVRWWPTAASARAWIASHRTAHGLHVEAHHAGDALKRARAAGHNLNKMFAAAGA